MGSRTMRGTVLKSADLDIEGLDPGGGNFDGEAEVLDEDDLLVILAGGALLLTLLTALLPLLLLLRTSKHNQFKFWKKISELMLPMIRFLKKIIKGRNLPVEYGVFLCQ